MIGLVLHGLILAFMAFPLFACMVPLFLDNVDPTYFLIRNVNFLPFRVKLLCRMLILFTTVFQLNITGVGFFIILANVLLRVTISLTRITPFTPSRYRNVQFFKFFLQYRQLQVINRVWNDTCYLLRATCCRATGRHPSPCSSRSSWASPWATP